MLITVSCLHLGQNNGKCLSIVSARIFNRVLPLHTGHNIHCSICTLSPQFLKIFIRFQYQIVETLSCPCLLEYRQPPFSNSHFEILRIPQKHKVFRLLWLYRNYP